MTHAWLFVGISVCALTAGFTTGGSASPVASAAVPAIFALVTSVVALLKNEKVVPKGKEMPPPAQSESRDVLDSRCTHIRIGGIALTCFGSFYLFGALIGTTARTHEWFAPTPSTPITALSLSDEDSRPKTLEEALVKLSLEERLRSLGYREDDVKELLALPVQNPLLPPSEFLDRLPSRPPPNPFEHDP